ncbi:MAG: AMP-binding protein [Burkholderiaceae bacterium]
MSYVSGPRHEPLAFTTVSALLDEACASNGAGDAAVFVEQGITLSWYDLRAKADQLAAGLLALGIRRGNRVAIWAPNRAEWLIAQFGTARIGAVLVNINPAYQKAELAFALKKVRARVLITARSHKRSDYLGMLCELAPEIKRALAGASTLYAQALPALKHVIVLGEGENPLACMSWRDLMNSAGPAHAARLPALGAQLDPDDPINIQFTSGTTGSPKGAVLSHFNIVNNARSTARAMQLGADDRLCLPVPLYHCFGMVLGVLACASVGATLVFPGESFEAGQTLAAAAEHRCTALHGVPTMFVAMLEHEQFRQFDLSRLRTGIMAGASCPVDVMQRVIADMNMAQVTIAYGMTETAPVSFQSGIDDPLDKRVATVGRIQPHVEVKIINEAGRIVPVGEQGELCTRGYCVMLGYYDEPALTAEAIDPAGWMHTGDLAVIDEQGYCQIVGRLKDMVIRGGENIYPLEVEEFLRGHPGILDVQVFGLPHERLGEQLCAWVIAKPGQTVDDAQIKAWCAGSIAHFKVPEQFRFVSEFPMTVTGKPQKFVMRDQMLAKTSA